MGKERCKRLPLGLLARIVKGVVRGQDVNVNTFRLLMPSLSGARALTLEWSLGSPYLTESPRPPPTAPDGRISGDDMTTRAGEA
jgi:hypothetical protein